MKKKISMFLFAAMLISLMMVMSVAVGAEDAEFIPSASSPAVTDFTDDFNGAALSDKWTLCYTPTMESAETVGVANGKFTAAATNWNTFKTLKLYTGDAAWTDYAVEATVSVAAQDPRHIGVFVRGTDISSARYGLKGYYIALNVDKRSYVTDGANGKFNDYPLIVNLYSYDGTTEIPLAAFEAADKHYAKNTDYDLKVLVCGNTLRIYLDGEFVGQYRDSTYKAGYAGINQYMAAFSLDNFVVRALSAKELDEFGVVSDSDSKYNFLFNADFNGNAIPEGMTVCYTPTAEASETVGVSEGRFTAAATNWNTFKKLKLYAGDETWTNYAAEASFCVSAQDPRHMGIFVRGADITEDGGSLYGYYVALNVDKRSYVTDGVNGKYNDHPLKIDVYSCGGGTDTVIETFYVDGKHYAKNTYYKLKVIAFENVIRIYLDDEFVGQLTDDVYVSGCAGINQYMAAFSLDYFAVRELTVDEMVECGYVVPFTEFIDEFDDDKLSDKWELYYNPTSESAETVGVANGKFTAAATNWNTFKELRLSTGYENWTDYAVEASISVSAADPRHAGVFVRGSGIGAGRYDLTGYYIAIDTDKRNYVTDGTNGKYADHPLKINVYNYDGNTETLLESFTVEDKHFAKNTFFDLKVLVCGNMLRIYVDGVFAGELTDDAYKSGCAGINQYMAAFSLERFAIRSLTPYEVLECGGDPFIPSENPPAVTEFTDNFEGDALSPKWTQCYEPTNANNEKIEVKNGKLSIIASNWNTFKALKFHMGRETWEDYAVEATFNVIAQDPRSIGLLVRASDVGAGRNSYKGYYIAINTKYSGEGMEIIFYTSDGAVETPIDSFIVPEKTFAKNRNYTLKALVCGNSVRIYLDGEFVGQCYDNTYKNGYVGLNQYMASCYIDDFSVRELKVYEYVEFGVIISEETEEKDGGFFTGIIMVMLHKKSGDTVPVEIAPIEGVAESFDGDTLSDKWTVCYEPTVVDEATVDSYALKDGQLVASATHWNSVKKMRFYTGDSAWADYAVETTFTPNGTDPRSIGVFVRASEIGTERYAYQGYYVHINTDKRSGTALNIQIEKCDGKAGEIVLSRNVGTRTFAKGKAYKLTVLAYGDTMRVYVDGEFVCQYKDDTYKNGYVGINTYMTTFKADDFTVRTLTKKEVLEFSSKVKDTADIHVEADLSKAAVVDLSSVSAAEKLLTIVEFTENGINGLSEFDEAEGALSLKYSESAGASAEYGSRIKFQLKFKDAGALADGKSYMVVTYKTDMQSGAFRMNNLRSVSNSLLIAGNIGVSAGEYVKTAPVNINATTDDGSNSLNNYYERLNKHKNGVLFYVENGEKDKSFFIKEIAFFASEAEAAAYAASK